MGNERLAEQAQRIAGDARRIANAGMRETTTAELEVCRIRMMALQVEAAEDLYAKLDEILIELGKRNG